MRILTSKKRSPIGIDLGSRVLKAVQLGYARSGHVVAASASIARTSLGNMIDQSEVQRLSRVLSQQGFSGRRVVLGVPSDQLMSSVLDMPPRDSGAPYHMIANQEFARLQSQEPGKFEAAWWDIPQPARTSSAKVMTVGCAHADTDPLLDVFEACGFDVAAMDFGLCAAVRTCGDQLESTQKISAVLDMGWGSARLALVHESVLVFDRTFAGSGMDGLLARVGDALAIEPEEAECLIQSIGLRPTDADSDEVDVRAQAVAPLLRPIFISYLREIAHEVEASFEYASHQYPGAEPHRLILIGGGGAVPGIAEQLNTMIVPEVLSTEVVSGDERAGDGEALMTTAQGLAGYYDQG
jgi:Tfp pilus assembly PilM family ATPase